MRFFAKKLLHILIITTLCLLVSQCGFRLRNQNHLPPQFRLIYLSSDHPYDKFIILLKQNLMQMGLTLTDSPKAAPITLKIIEAKLTHSAPDITTSDKARTYTLTYRVQFTLEGVDGKVFLPTQTILTNKTLTLNPGQTLYSNNELNLVKQEMQREALTLLLYRLETKQVKDAFQ